MSPPSFWAIIARAAAWAMRKLPLAMTSCWRSQSASVVSSSGLLIDRPALLTSRSMPPKASSVASTAACTWVASVTSACTPTATSLGPISAEACRDGPADAAGGAGDEGDAAGVAAWLGHPLELGLLEGPVLDAELLRLVDGRIGRHRLGAAHDVDR